MTQKFRIGNGHSIDVRKPIRFRFDGVEYSAWQGDTLASALLANGVGVVARSFKYHRPRGIFSAGVEEPNALVEVGEKGRHHPNLRATEVLLHDGLEARGQNAWPSVRWDIGSMAQFVAPLLGAGFYYKTFMRPAWAWPWYEAAIRRAAGLGRAPSRPDGGRHDKRRLFCDVLVVGAGPAGLMAAHAAANGGARVLIADERDTPGGLLLDDSVTLDGMPCHAWVEYMVTRLKAMANVRLLRRTTVHGRYHHHRYQLLQRDEQGTLLIAVNARHTVMATGAIERPLMFANNDVPGVMLSGAVRRYLRGYGVVPGLRPVILTNNDSGYACAQALCEAGITPVAILDQREEVPNQSPGPMDGLAEVSCLTGVRIKKVHGRKRIKRITLESVGVERHIDCDLLCVSGGWTPTLHLLAQGGLDNQRVAFSDDWGALVPVGSMSLPDLTPAGSCAGVAGLVDILLSGREAGIRAVQGLESKSADRLPAIPCPVFTCTETSPLVSGIGSNEVGEGAGTFVDLQHDVQVKDLELALREGYRSIEHVKRYTTLGMGTDQGRTSNINGMSIVAQRLSRPVEEVGTTTFRPPFSPAPLGSLAGRESGERLDATRYSPMHDWHQQHGAVFMPSSLWVRPQYYRLQEQCLHGRRLQVERQPDRSRLNQHQPAAGRADEGTETLHEAACREARNVRERVGIADVSTLGKIELQGPDVAEFLDRIYLNNPGKAPLHKARYGLMLREDGRVFDDGTVVRIAEQRFLISTTTVNAAAVLAHLEFHQQMVWPELKVMIEPVTEQWAVVALAGPRSREVLARTFPDDDVSNEAFPFLAYRETTFDAGPARLFRISFSGELAYEVAVPADNGLALWQRLLEQGVDLGIAPYGLEAMDYLRIEKGHLIVGADIDGRVTPMDIGMGGMLRGENDCVGRRSLALPALSDRSRQRLSGFRSCDGHSAIPAGAQLLLRPWSGEPQRSLGRITSPGYSVMQEAPIALGLVEPVEKGSTLYAVAPLTDQCVQVEVTDTVFHDPKGERLRA